MRVAWEITTEGEGVAGRLGKVLSCGSSGIALFWGGDVGDIVDNGAEVRGSACGFPEKIKKVKGKAAKGQVIAEGGSK